jgi:hypothetical protein
MPRSCVQTKPWSDEPYEAPHKGTDELNAKRARLPTWFRLLPTWSADDVRIFERTAAHCAEHTPKHAVRARLCARMSVRVCAGVWLRVGYLYCIPPSVRRAWCTYAVCARARVKNTRWFCVCACAHTLHTPCVCARAHACAQTRCACTRARASVSQHTLCVRARACTCAWSSGLARWSAVRKMNVRLTAVTAVSTTTVGSFSMIGCASARGVPARATRRQAKMRFEQRSVRSAHGTTTAGPRSPMAGCMPRKVPTW